MRHINHLMNSTRIITSILVWKTWENNNSSSSQTIKAGREHTNTHTRIRWSTIFFMFLLFLLQQKRYFNEIMTTYTRNVCYLLVEIAMTMTVIAIREDSTKEIKLNCLLLWSGWTTSSTHNVPFLNGMA